MDLVRQIFLGYLTWDEREKLRKCSGFSELCSMGDPEGDPKNGVSSIYLNINILALVELADEGFYLKRNLLRPQPLLVRVWSKRKSFASRFGFEIRT